MQLLIDIEGDVQVERVLARFVGRLEDVTPAWDQIADDIAGFEQRQFDSEGRFGSGGWSPLSPRYRASKEKRFPGKGILEATGALRESFSQRPFGVEVIQPHSMEVGSDVPYAKYHQHGDGVPQRRPLEIPGEQRTEITKTLQRFLVTGEPR